MLMVFQKVGIICKPAAFISTICDERGQELSYCGVTISQILERQLGIGGTISLLWYVLRFIVVVSWSFFDNVVGFVDSNPDGKRPPPLKRNSY